MSELRIVEDWSDPETRGHTIPGARYTSKEFFEQEWEGMWTKVWLLLGREAEIPNHGDWQMELSIPYNDCLHPDPCEMCSKWASLSNWMISESCATQGTDSQDMKFCSGMMGKYIDC